MTMAMPEMSSEFEQIGLPPPDQIGLVVRDLDAAIALYNPIFGPFHKVDFGANKASYRGGEPEAYDLRFAFGRIGPLEIELIEWVSGNTPHRDFLERGRDGMHHLRFRVDDLDAWTERLRSIGFDTVWFDRMSPEIAYAYFERAGDPLLLELLQFPQDADPAQGA